MARLVLRVAKGAAPGKPNLTVRATATGPNNQPMTQEAQFRVRVVK